MRLLEIRILSKYRRQQFRHKPQLAPIIVEHFTAFLVSALVNTLTCGYNFKM